MKDLKEKYKFALAPGIVWAGCKSGNGKATVAVADGGPLRCEGGH